MSSESIEPLQVNSPSSSVEKSAESDSSQQTIQIDDNKIAKKSTVTVNGNGVCCVTDKVPDYRKELGWLRFRPKCLQGLLSAKWALFWLCWAGALQGNYLFVDGIWNSMYFLRCLLRRL